MGKERKDFRWRYQPTNLQDICLLKYIQNYSVASTTEMILTALRAFWLPIALAHEPKFDIATKQQIASKYVDILLRQADAICQAVGIASPRAARVGELTVREPVPVQKEAGEEKPDSLSSQQLLLKEGGTGFSTQGLSKWLISS